MKASLRSLDDLAPAPYNPRVIRDLNLKRLRLAIKRFGDLGGIVWNRRTRHLVCGHQRLRALRDEFGDRLKLRGAKVIAPNGEAWPVRVVDWAEKVERAANVTANSPTVSGEFTSGLADLLGEMADESKAVVEELGLSELVREEAEIDETPDDHLEEEGPTRALALDVRFESDNAFDIPDLLPGLIPVINGEMKTWAGSDASRDDGRSAYYLPRGCSQEGAPFARGVFGTYASDERFESLWKRTDRFAMKLRNKGITMAFSPNWSSYFDAPLAARIWNTYRSRWVGRYLQEAGVRVIPDLQGQPADLDWCLQGLPVRAPCAAFQCQTAMKDGALRLKGEFLTAAVKRLRPQRVFAVVEQNRLDEILAVAPTLSRLVSRVQPMRELRRPLMEDAGSRKRKE